MKRHTIRSYISTFLIVLLIFTSAFVSFSIFQPLNVLADTTDEYKVTKSILLKTSMGTYGKEGYYSSEFYTSLTYNDRWLTVDDKSEYSYGAAKFSVVLSSAIYSGISSMIDSPSYSSDKTAILNVFGFVDTHLYSISNSDGVLTDETDDVADANKNNNDNNNENISDSENTNENEETGDDSDAYIDKEDATTIVIGHKPVVVDGQAHDVYVVVIRGTTGAAEWESNYDVGNTSEEYTEKTGEHPEWTDYDNHKGFDVVANRVKDLLDTYVATYHTDDSIADYLVTGHSRGAGIANILGAKLEAEGYNSCAYTFASPNTTTAPDKYSSQTVFNIINANDFITTLPLAEWGFARYGTDIIVDLANDEATKAIADKSLGMEYSGKDPSFLTNAFSGIATTRDELYTDETFECVYDSLDEKNTAYSSTQAAIEYLNLENFITIEDCSGTNADGKYYFNETLSVGSFMVGLSRIMSDQADFFSMFLTINHLNNVFPKDSVYSQALNEYMTALTSNLLESFYPHMTTCYYAIVEGINEASDSDEANSANSSDTTVTDSSQISTDTSSNESDTYETSSFIGSIAFYIIISIALIACAVATIIIIRKKIKER